LTYVTQLPTIADRVGLSWISEEEFKMHKVILSGVMGIKPNTLNVNLRDLCFVQRQRSKDGWSFWCRPGFCRTSCGIDIEIGQGISLGPLHACLPFKLGHLTDSQIELFQTGCHILWNEIFQCPPTSPITRETALERTAIRFRYNEQTIQNAKDVIEAILLPSAMDVQLGFTEFAKFLAMFGPEKTIMVKIAALLKCSNATGKWLTFDRIVGKPPFATFAPTMPNCLVIHHGDGAIERVYNLPSLEREYLVDDFGKTGRDWDDWFTAHPVRNLAGQK
jgi:hypothetical protein